MGVDAVLSAFKMPAGGFVGSVSVPLFYGEGLKMVGPFVTFVHTPAATFKPGALPDDSDVRPHPHIGIATISYLIAGSMTHRDATGAEAEIGPGDLAWMSAGRGLVHSERYGALRRHGGTMEGFQVWTALPDEDSEPAFLHLPAEQIPWFDRDGVRHKVLAGRFGELTSPVPAASPLFLIDVTLAPGATLHVPPEYRERAAYVVAGSITCDGNHAEVGQTALMTPGADISIEAEQGARLICFGGDPIGPRLLWWNLVASEMPRIEAAKAAWRAGRMPLPVGDDEDFTPCPADDGRPLLHLEGFSRQ